VGQLWWSVDGGGGDAGLRHNGQPNQEPGYYGSNSQTDKPAHSTPPSRLFR
jgi:hypothetical protein